MHTSPFTCCHYLAVFMISHSLIIYRWRRSCFLSCLRRREEWLLIFPPLQLNWILPCSQSTMPQRWPLVLNWFTLMQHLHCLYSPRNGLILFIQSYFIDVCRISWLHSASDSTKNTPARTSSSRWVPLYFRTIIALHCACLQCTLLSLCTCHCA